VGTIWQDLRYGARLLLKKPGFTIAALAMLTLGIGASTTILCVIDAVLLAPLPFPEPDRLLKLEERHPGVSSYNFTYANYFDLARITRTLHDVAAYRPWQFNLSAGREPETVDGYLVTPNFFSAVGTTPLLGRTFTEQDDQPGSDHVVILSYAIWQRRFGSEEAIVGKNCKLNGTLTRIIGVMPDGFRFPDAALLWKPLAPDGELLRNRRSHLLAVVGRMNPGTRLNEVRAEMHGLSSAIDAENQGVDPDWFAYAVPFLQSSTAGVRLPLLLFLAAVGLLLLLVCVNVANLQLVRAVGRTRELGIRIALGIGKGRLLLLAMLENILLALVAAFMSVWLAHYGLKLIVALAPADIPRLETVQIDARVLCALLLLTVFVGLLFGLLPALQALRTGPSDALKSAQRVSATMRESRLFHALIVAEVALSLLLLTAAGLLTNSFVRLMQVPLGFNPQNILAIELFSPDVTEARPDARILEKWQDVLEKVRSVPGVQSAGLVNNLPISSGVATDFEIPGRPPFSRDNEPSAEVRITDWDYFRTMQIPILEGRGFSREDLPDSPKVVLINRTMADRFWPGEDPVGKRLTMKDWGPPLTGEIVGVVGDVKQNGPDTPVNSMIYWPYTQFPSLFNCLVVRTTVEGPSVLEGVRREIWSVDPEWPLAKIRTMEQVLASSVAQRRFSMILAGVFASISLALAAIGIAGVMAFATEQRTQEIGIRRALGAQTVDIVQMVLSLGFRLIFLGIAIGLAAALVASRLLTHLLFNVSASDPFTYFTAASVVVLAAAVACYLPARSATRVDPMVVLRYE
jgi:putative ABC transport system permease protein